MSIEKFQPSYDIYPERIERLKAVAPEAFADGKINWDNLKESLGSFVEDEGAETEHYAFTWPGKREARRMAGKPPQGTLVPVSGEGVNEDSTENIFIEGDNLEVLKLLQKSYAGKIKMIYIDPPYNTGNDFIYNDNFTQPLDEYLKLTGQIDAQGTPLVSNRKASGRFHSKWMNMMYPRLKLAQNLLRDDGVIFISIDDNEIKNLRLLCDEVFGEENFFVQIPWQSRTSVQNDTDISVQHEYLVAYARIRRQEHRRLKESNVDVWYALQSFAAYPLPLDRTRYDNPDNDQRGPWKADPFDAPAIRENLTYKIVNPKTGEEFLPPEGRHWRTEENKYKELLADNRIVFGKTGESRPQLKVFYEEKKQFGEVPTSWFDGTTYGTSTNGTQELQDLFDGSTPFSFPKPTSLIKALLTLCTRDGDMVMDFFVGSGTTAHAVLSLNVDEKAGRKFIVAQLPEPVEAGDFKTIAEIAKERIRRAIKKVRVGKSTEELLNQDLGFKVVKLQKSHFNEWKDYKGSDVKELMDLFAKQEDALVAGWKPENLLFEIMLQEGFPLHSKIEPIEAIKSNKVIQVKSELCQHVIFICLDEKVDKQTIEQLPLTDKDIFICLDKALTDEQKVALSDKGVIKTI